MKDCSTRNDASGNNFAPKWNPTVTHIVLGYWMHKNAEGERYFERTSALVLAKNRNDNDYGAIVRLDGRSLNYRGDLYSVGITF